MMHHHKFSHNVILTKIVVKKRIEAYAIGLYQLTGSGVYFIKEALKKEATFHFTKQYIIPP